MEAVVVTPLLLLVALLVVAFGRVADARIRVEDAAQHAARAASLARDPEQAEQAARKAAASALDVSGAGCASHSVRLRHDGLTPGSAVTATVSCEGHIGDLTGSALPGSLRLNATTTSPIDPFRSTR
ncbi:TadE/TadG family type IV pilus assembly protein [Streptomyces sp. NBC_01803]|uniref:TadE/TadG family type IV pilus assembly protein n=1 Tax=Streptomyces sp. NBC_01803 TaxID=2975946 RepID=UPI002DD8798C|nr:TadE/TadG family type IV pilus assembly protein [Streptomyces sp. NBC_01803]WSA44206.1 pilus assembly protein [Streptomyces sp. NBC_01803]